MSPSSPATRAAPAAADRRPAGEQRDVTLPERLLRLSELRGLLTEYQRRGAEQKRTAGHLLFGVENCLKAHARPARGAAGPAVLRPRWWTQERKLKEAVAKNPEWQKSYGGAWDAIAEALGTSRASARTTLPGGSARASPAICSGTPARWCARPRSAPSRSRSASASSATRPSRPSPSGCSARRPSTTSWRSPP